MEYPVLEGRRVRLRPVRPDDLTTVYPWVSDPERSAPFDRFSIDSFEAFSESVHTDPADLASTAPRFLVERSDPRAPLGVVGYYCAHPVLSLLDVWYMMGASDERGKGYGREAVGLLVRYLFESTPFERVGATCDVENVPSARLVERLGFRREGTLRSALFHHSRWHDVAVYGITRSEWMARPTGSAAPRASRSG